jgi:dimeric dUTPase (all-alpha-NTP-PPase superfamily)
LFRHYVYLGELLGFSHEEVFDAYVKKNEVNYNRQKEGY